MNKYFLVVVALVIGVALGCGIGFYGTRKSYQAQLERAKQFFPTMSDVRSLSGKVKSIGGNVVTVEIAPLANPFEEWPTLREVVVGKDTKIVKSGLKDPKEFAKEQEEYQRAIAQSQRQSNPAAAPGAQPPAVLPTPPLPFTEKEIAFKDLKVGDQVMVEAKDNIKLVSRFEATRISVQEMMAPAALPTTPPAASGSLPPAPATPPRP